MFQATILICALGVDPVACTSDSAIERLSIKAVSMQQCLFQSETTMAPTKVSPIFGKEYAKIVCHGEQDAAR